MALIEIIDSSRANIQSANFDRNVFSRHAMTHLREISHRNGFNRNNRFITCKPQHKYDFLVARCLCDRLDDY